MARYWRRRLRRRAFAGWQRGERKMITVDDKITYSPHRLNSSACESSSREGPVENNSGSGYRVEGCKEKDGPCGICGFSDWPKDCPGRKNDDGTTCAYIGQLQEVDNRETLSAAYWKDKASAASATENSDTARDAARYRWLRSASVFDGTLKVDDGPDWWGDLGDALADNFDEMVDAAMAAADNRSD